MPGERVPSLKKVVRVPKVPTGAAVLKPNKCPIHLNLN